MKPIKLIGFILALAAVLITMIIVVQLLRSSSNSPLQLPGATASPHKCFPTPHEATDIGTRTPTPKPGQIVTPAPFASVTPLPGLKTTDLAPGLAEEDKGGVMVMHCNGTFELFLIDPNILRTETRPYFLKPDDFILNVFPPASMMGHQPPPPPDAFPTLSGSPMPFNTLPPYPPPGAPNP